MTLGRRVEYGTYEDLASEYYDGGRHPTSANFRTASRAILEAWLPASLEGRTCDVGAGCSLVAELFVERKSPVSDLVLVDSSPEMLAHSQPWLEQGATGIVADASSIPFPDDAFELLVASLGDPYNTPEFWAEAKRVVRPGGRIIFTTPSYEWASWFRTRQQEPPDSAEFLLSDGRKLRVPSYVQSESDQISTITSAGSQTIGIYHVLLAALRAEHVSPKAEVSGTTPLVTGYLVDSG